MQGLAAKFKGKKKEEKETEEEEEEKEHGLMSEDGDEEEEPIRASTPLPGAARGRKQSFGNRGGLRGTSIPSRGSSTHSRGSTTIRLVDSRGNPHKK